ncbi:restriction endonuclease [Levilactobacillus suantsaiihabitans]|uniref:Restriction endonuclease n=1 Tax=Levilactobacillus suantsaiihabitans TaxID=2487722 RepID=A0A4Z0JC16_9LACO|nr:restriction endonuclease [Levilactobacillus suantsaiihabitans]TGD19994.1 restriction endonuclease [Levilactobacillus suantsaiihabitans]
MDYHQLKIGKHGLPTWDALGPSVLALVATKPEWHGRKLNEAVADDLQLPADLRQLTYPNQQNIIENRAGWAVSEMTTAGILRRTRRGYYAISKLGQQIAQSGVPVTRELMHQQPLYIQHERDLAERRQRKQDTVVPETDDEAATIDQLTQQVNAYNDEVATNLLQRIREAEPAFFENLVVKLLSAMGYKGPNGSSWVTQLSNDGGIDGVINQDALGTSTVYVQAKRYEEANTVQRPAIDSFYGALSRYHADRGVFITTSSFSAKAIETAKSFSIVLVDGIQLTELMLQYHVGVQVKQQLEIFEIDQDFFED